MKIFLDTSDVNVISKHCESGLIDGVTTNPTLMKQSGRNPIDVIKDISALFPDDSSISAEVVADTAEGMISQAKQYYSISPNITIKVPCTEEGLKACNVLSAKNIPVNVTLIFSVTQAILCAKAGAKFVSPFIGRCEDNGLSGIGLIESIRTIFDRNNIKTQILAAPIRTTEHVTNAFIAGTDIVTLPPSIFEEMYKHDLTDQGIDQFDKDWKQVNHK
ncbi:MAG: fructose-6-phosphate aldolase [bacterium TMED274]|nr:MAG: fructose-6-phosphate aldolase [bacterium TMED274]|tara:strand:+ start:49148 stop:49801 length:654 start_codon:yes stop_codon:yes gene_type:complete